MNLYLNSDYFFDKYKSFGFCNFPYKVIIKWLKFKNKIYFSIVIYLPNILWCLCYRLYWSYVYIHFRWLNGIKAWVNNVNILENKPAISISNPEQNNIDLRESP